MQRSATETQDARWQKGGYLALARSSSVTRYEGVSVDSKCETLLESLLVCLHDQARLHVSDAGRDGSAYARGLRDAADQLSAALEESRRVTA